MRLFVIALLSLFLFNSSCFSSEGPKSDSKPTQIQQRVKWTFSASKTDVKIGDEVELIFKAQVDDHWYMYANDFPDCGPMLTEIFFSETKKNFEAVGKTIAINPESKYDSVFECTVKIFKKHGEFRQKIKVTGAPLTISGSIEGQVCSDVCIPFASDFSFSFKVAGSNSQSSVTPTETENSKQNTVTTPDTATQASAQVAKETSTEVSSKSKGPQLDPTILGNKPEEEATSMVGYFVLAFVLGLTSLITPCVFPMIPMTVTFFLRDGQSRKTGVRNAVIFGLSIIGIYTTAGTIFAIMLGPEGLNALATHWVPNLLIFLMFIAFALSFLGLFEINAPYKLVNKADQASEKGGLLGIFFMSATLVLVSFSCTIPIVSNVLVLSAAGQWLKPIVGMFGYSLAFAIPFTLFAIFPEWMKSVPKSGGWLNTVKVTLGLLELALAFKFLSIVDQTYHWGILDREINIGLWIVIFTFLGFYLLGKIRMSSDSIVEKVSVGRLMSSIAIFTFVIYLIPGLWGAPLKALAGYLPPMYTHDFDLISLQREATSDEQCEPPKYADFLHLPHGLTGYFDYDQALACARQQNKPLFIDFTGHGCVNCREMEANVWADPAVLKKLREDFVIVALYVDDKTSLPENEWYTSTYDKKVKKTIGKKNADLQITNLNHNAQPYYVIVGKDERLLAWPRSYDRDVNDFAAFLESAKKTYNNLY